MKKFLVVKNAGDFDASKKPIVDEQTLIDMGVDIEFWLKMECIKETDENGSISVAVADPTKDMQLIAKERDEKIKECEGLKSAFDKKSAECDKACKELAELKSEHAGKCQEAKTLKAQVEALKATVKKHEDKIKELDELIESAK